MQTLIALQGTTGSLAVQLRARSGALPLPARIHRAAQAGVTGPSQRLPHYQAIQRSFGPAHDLSDVQAYVGGPATRANEVMHATAYTTGEDVAFKAEPDLWLAAHEAVHVVQQRSGVSLSGGVGRAGDPYERQAEAVADRVVSGQPTHELLSSSRADGRSAVRHGGSVRHGDCESAKGAGETADGTSTAVQRNEDGGLPEETESAPAIAASTVASAAGEVAASVKSAGNTVASPAGPAVEDREQSAPTAGAIAAVKAARTLMMRTSPALWFDSWGNDLRDNNRNGAVDDRSEQGLADGSHHGRIFTAQVCRVPYMTIDACPNSQKRDVNVEYKVCIDIPIESYRAAGVSISTSRWIPTFFSNLAHMPGWRVWSHGRRPAILLSGDIVAASNADHQHAGIVDSGLINWVINLPGPTSHRKYGLYDPNELNDMVAVPRLLFEAVLGIDYVARRVR